MLNDLNLAKIRMLAEVSRHHGLQSASETLRVTPSALSQSIRQLEASLGHKLFLRVGKRLLPTPITQRLVEQSLRYFETLSEFLENPIPEILELRIGAPPIFGSTTLLDRLAPIRAEFPTVRILLNLMDTRRIIEDLLGGNLDFGFVDGGNHLRKHRELSLKPFWKEELVLCCAATFHRAHVPRRPTRQTLARLPHIPYNQDQEGVHKWYAHQYGRCPEFQYSMAIDNTHGVLNAVRKGWGLGVLPKGLIETDIKNDQLAVVAGPRGNLASTVLFAQNRNRVPAPTEKQIIRRLLK
jgi:DNA-binding transcriptional LysR family regulator